MTVDNWLEDSKQKLQKSGVDSAQLDALILLEDELNKDRSWILAHRESEIKPESIKRLTKKVQRRIKHEPLAYIRGFTEFYGRNFKINKHVLEPRPESETMIDLLKTLKVSKNQSLVDVGTGSGALGITAALELHNDNVDLIEIDAGALAVAKHNCALHELHLHTIKRDLLKNTHKPYDVILANLPYVPTNFYVNQSAKMEPRIAIAGGSDGLHVYRRMFEQLSHFSWRPKYILTEAMPPQHKGLAEIAKSAGFKELKKQDFIQVFTG